MTFLIQYAFLSAFFWMLCEGIMMYILLVRVFGAHDKKWRLLFLIIGWGAYIASVHVGHHDVK